MQLINIADIKEQLVKRNRSGSCNLLLWALSGHLITSFIPLERKETFNIRHPRIVLKMSKFSSVSKKALL